MKKISISSDHGGFDLKEDISLFLDQLGYEIKDFGPNNSDAVDYPDYAITLATHISNNIDARGIVICGTGVGMSIVVNRFPGIRGALCSDIYTAKLSREHNDSNLLIMGGRVIGFGLAREIVKVWLSTPFEGGRHKKRLDKITQFEKSNKL